MWVAEVDENRSWVWNVWDRSHPQPANHFVCAVFDSNGAADDFNEENAHMFAELLNTRATRQLSATHAPRTETGVDGAGREETTFDEVVRRIREGTYYDDYDWASGPALRALDVALNTRAPQPSPAAEPTDQQIADAVVTLAHSFATVGEQEIGIDTAAGRCRITVAPYDVKQKPSPAAVDEETIRRWNPINTAPRDREIIIGVQVDARWRAWISDYPFGCDGTYGDEPTHWIEVPSKG